LCQLIDAHIVWRPVKYMWVTLSQQVEARGVRVFDTRLCQYDEMSKKQGLFQKGEQERAVAFPFDYLRAWVSGQIGTGRPKWLEKIDTEASRRFV
jgi:hypothetical protein